MTSALGSTLDSAPRDAASPSALSTLDDVDAFVAEVRGLVDRRLSKFFADKRAETERISPRSVELVASLESLTMRGGKRLRPVVTAAAMFAVDPRARIEAFVEIGAALELLQTYLLAHDDFMDGDLERRGGPAVHAIFRASYGDEHVGDSLGVLAGDLASDYCLELALSSSLAPATQRAVLDALLQLRKEVYFGQHLDVIGDADVSRMHDLKTGSYTVRGPARLGGVLGDATARELETLRAWADPLGEAFQLADDLLGTFGQAKDTGKPGEDLRHGKRTSLVMDAESRLPAAERVLLARVLGDRNASDADVAALVSAFEEHGVKASIEARAKACLDASERALEAGASGLDARGRARLSAIGRKLAVRDR